MAHQAKNLSRERVLAMLANRQDMMRRFSVKGLYLFGSIARGEGQEGSDVDILVEYEPGARVGMFQCQVSRVRCQNGQEEGVRR